jgi:hypothetical protein
LLSRKSLSKKLHRTNVQFTNAASVWTEQLNRAPRKVHSSNVEARLTVSARSTSTNRTRANASPSRTSKSRSADRIVVSVGGGEPPCRRSAIELLPQVRFNGRPAGSQETPRWPG